ncbi:hypothetical protein AAFC00_002388 [Neodothiora populina]|uniref:Carboxylic ester hydrolase n=1 Tax=Neodothiora populina TaxID=2781224 RepID=A0ABR3P8A6_9PEZI
MVPSFWKMQYLLPLALLAASAEAIPLKAPRWLPNSFWAAAFPPQGMPHTNVPNATTTQGADMPVIDLGYSVQKAFYHNEAVGYYEFTNIPYAAPPVGNLRWRAPQPPPVNRTTNVGGGTLGCYAGVAGWGRTAAYNLYNQGIDVSFLAALNGAGSYSEDCLKVDVYVPESVNKNKLWQKVPVIVDIHGGGYIGGHKGMVDPSGLLAAGVAAGQPFIFVAPNYRLGAFGFLGGAGVQADGVANAGLLDQRFALNWVKQYIWAFGGDPTRITVLGESAGASSIGFQLGAVGSYGPTPFGKAIIQSPAALPLSYAVATNDTQQFLAKLGVKDIGSARSMNTAAIQAANLALVGSASYGTDFFGPSVDNTFVKAPLPRIWLNGNFDRSIPLITAHNGNEGALFSPASVTSDAAFIAYVKTVYNGAPDHVINTIANQIYPSPSNSSSSLPYTTQAQRATVFVADAFVNCNSYALDKGSNGWNFNYNFNTPSQLDAIHGSDQLYNFYNNGSSPKVNATVAITMQSTFINFAYNGFAGAKNQPSMPRYGAAGQALSLTSTGYTVVADPVANARCQYLASYAPYVAK